MSSRRILLTLLTASCAAGASVARPAEPGAARLRFAVRLPAAAGEALDGRLLLLLSTDPAKEPRLQIVDTDAIRSQQVFGRDVEGWRPGEEVVFDASVSATRRRASATCAPGAYRVQALLHRYETFHRADGHVVKLPMDRGEGQQWNLAPGNLYSTPREVDVDPSPATRSSRIVLDQVIPPIPDPPDTRYIKHVKIRSELLSAVLGPADVPRRARAAARRVRRASRGALPPGHLPRPLLPRLRGLPGGAARPRPACEYSERFHLDCYNRIEQEEAYQFYQDWTSPDFPRFIVHRDPAPEPVLRRLVRGELGEPGTLRRRDHARAGPRTSRSSSGASAKGGRASSTAARPGGWEALAVQVFYPDEYNGCCAACPDPIDFRAFTSSTSTRTRTPTSRGAVDARAPPRPPRLARARVGHDGADEPPRARPGHEGPLGRSSGTSGRPSTRRWARTAIPGRSGTSAPARSTTRWPSTGARTTTSSTSCGATGRRASGRKLEGKIHIYVGDMDNYYLNNAVYLTEDFLEAPPIRTTAARWTTATGPSTAGTATTTRPNATLAPALQPDVRAQDRRAHREERAGGRRPDELAVLAVQSTRPPMASTTSIVPTASLTRSPSTIT